MPWIIDYHHVLDRMRALRLRSAYYNSGAFAFPSGESPHIVGWLGPEDPTIHHDLPAILLPVHAPYPQTLASKLIHIWQHHIDGPAWLMPASHWAYEMDFGSRAWLPGLLDSIGIDPGLLETRTNASAIEFVPDEKAALQTAVATLLESLVGSDFTIVFPHHRHLVTLHHHKQIWWQTDNVELVGQLGSC